LSAATIAIIGAGCELADAQLAPVPATCGLDSWVEAEGFADAEGW